MTAAYVLAHAHDANVHELCSQIHRSPLHPPFQYGNSVGAGRRCAEDRHRVTPAAIAVTV